MTKPYRLTIFKNGAIDRMQPFEARDAAQALEFAERQRHGRQAELWDTQGLVERFAADAPENAASTVPRFAR